MNTQQQCIRASEEHIFGECSGPVTYGPDPFQQDVHGDETPVWECDGHRAQSAWEI